MVSADPIELVVTDQDAGMRLDAFLASRCATHSRARLQEAIAEKKVQVDGDHRKAAYRVTAGQHVSLVLPAPLRPAPAAEAMDLDVLFEDDHLVAINKPAGLVVHPSKGHLGGTLANALAHHFAQLSQVGGPTRPGIVHRLDRDTSGVIVIAKTDASHMALAAQWEDRTVAKEYYAVVAGVPDRDRDRINQPIGIHPQQREKMAIRANHATSRNAETFYEVLERFDGFATMRLSPKTGRTHQIRVHLAHVGFPVLCDRLYGGRSAITIGEIRRTDDPTPSCSRQALHAHRLRLSHPHTAEPLELVAPLPADITRLVAQLRQWR